MSRLDEIKARADVATPGPWHAWDRGIGWEVHKGEECAPGCGRSCDALNGEVRDTFTRADAEFIAAAREDEPWLVSEVERLTAERDALAAQVARVESLAEWFDSVQEEHLLQYDCQCEMKDCYECGPWHACTHNGPPGRARQIRDALAGSEADTTEREARHRCEPYYSRAECGQCGWQEQWCVTCSRQMCGCATDATNRGAMGADQ